MVSSSDRTSNVVIQRLTEEHRAGVADHFLALGPDGLRQRFGQESAGALSEYIAGIDFRRETVLGAIDGSGQLLGIAHVAVNGVTQLGLSVNENARHQGIGLQLAQAALSVARAGNAGAFELHTSADNDAMRRIATALGMTIKRNGAELTANLSLQPLATTSASERPLAEVV